jgi:phage protein D
VRLWLGWDDTGLIDKGSFTVDETEHSGAPDTLSIRARSADLRGGLKAKKERSFDATTLGTVIGAIATAQGLTPWSAPCSPASSCCTWTRPTSQTPTCSVVSAESMTPSPP